MEELVVLHEDNHVLVVLKPQGISIESQKDEPDLLTMAKTHLGASKASGAKSFCKSVFAIDKPVGGVVLFAKSAKALNRLEAQLAEGVLERTYYAVTVATPKQHADTLTHYIKQTKINGLELIPQTTAGAVKATLSYTLCDKADSLALLKVACSDNLPKQARFQLATLGLPVYADASFGKAISKANLALWLTDIRFTHPITERIMNFRIFPPETDAPWNKFKIAVLFKVI